VSGRDGEGSMSLADARDQTDPLPTPDTIVGEADTPVSE
jgi:hypothetical protein